MAEISMTAERMPIRRYESPMRVPWKEKNNAALLDLTAVLTKYNLQLPEPLVAFRGGGIVEPNSTELALGYKNFLANERGMAVIPVKEEAGGKLTDVIHFPAKKEDGAIRYDANLAAYKFHVGNFAYEHWDNTKGPPPLAQVRAVDELADGRFVTIDRYRPYLHGLGKGSGSLGIHEFDTQRLGIEDTRNLVHTLDAIHPNLDTFRSWITEKNVTLPKESLLSEKNPITALRGQEWWINPDAKMDRIRELGMKTDSLQKEFAAIDPSFKPKEALEQMIRNNISIFPHQNGTMDNPQLQTSLAVVHGALYPENIHQSQTPDRTKTYFTVTGGDRSHVGLAAESIDWLVAATAESPAHQEALISEFLTLHPSETDRRGLAMHVLYRTLSESQWFALQGKFTELNNLTKLSYDIMQGNGIWKGVNSPLAP